MMRASAELEESTEEHPVMYWAVQATYELLRDPLGALEQPPDAPDAQRACLTIWPRRYSGFLGAGRVQNLITDKSGLTAGLKTNADQEESTGMADARGPPSPTPARAEGPEPEEYPPHCLSIATNTGKEEAMLRARPTEVPAVASPLQTKGDIMTVEQNKAILQSGAKAFNHAEDRSGWFDIHDSSVIAEGVGPKPLDLEGLKEFYSGLWKAFPDLQMTIEDMVGEGDRVAWRLTVSGTHRSDFRGVPATGAEVKFAAQYIFRFSDGKIVERWTNFDRLGVMIQLGAIPAPV